MSRARKPPKLSEIDLPGGDKLGECLLDLRAEETRAVDDFVEEGRAVFADELGDLRRPALTCDGSLGKRPRPDCGRACAETS